MSKQVVIQQAPNETNPNAPGFFQDRFEQLIWEKGYRCIREKAIQCPCRSVRVNQLSNCKNCGSLGFLFINPEEIRVILRNQNENTTYKSWSAESIGNVSISTANNVQLCHMDKLTVLDTLATFGEVRHFKKSENDILFAYCSYQVCDVDYISMFVDESTKLTRLVKDIDYTFDGNRLFLTSKYVADYVDDNTYSVTIRYQHQPSYYVIDLPRQVAQSRKTYNSKEELIDLPISAVGKRSHFVLDAENIISDRLLDNSFIDNKCSKQIKETTNYCNLSKC
jgi:hypothetical protein